MAIDVFEPVRRKDGLDSLTQVRRRRLQVGTHLSTRLRIQAENAISLYLDDAPDQFERDRRANTIGIVTRVFRERAKKR